MKNFKKCSSLFIFICLLVTILVPSFDVSAISMMAAPKLTMKANSETSLTLNVTKVAGANGYEFYRSDSKDSGYKLVKATASATFTNTGLEKGRTYYFKARAYKKVLLKKTEYSTFSAVLVYKPIVTIEVYRNWDREFRTDTPVYEEILKKFRIKFKIQFIKDATQYTEKLNLRVASGDVPDVFTAAVKDVPVYAATGQLLKLNGLIDKYAVNMKKNYPAEVWDLAKINGNLYMIPSVNNNGKYVFGMRNDWLKNIGKPVPKTLDELFDVFKAFTTQDPDKNGKNDTYGLGALSSGFVETLMPIFGAFGIQFDPVDSTQWTLDKNGKIKTAAISNEYKNAIIYIKKLYEEKVMDPEIFVQKEDQAREKILNSKIGSFNAWWNATNESLMNQHKMKDISPTTEWAYVRPPIGPQGLSGVKGFGLISGALCISKKMVNPDVFMQFVDWAQGDEGYSLVSYGVEGKTYTRGDRGKWHINLTEYGQQLANAKQLDSFQMLIRRDILLESARIGMYPERYQAQKFALENNLLINKFEGIRTNENTRIAPDLMKFELEQFLGFIYGKRPISEFNQYVSEWKQKGGDTMRESLLKEYNRINKTNLSFAE